jgi:hypothetical protein
MICRMALGQCRCAGKHMKTDRADLGAYPPFDRYLRGRARGFLHLSGRDMDLRLCPGGARRANMRLDWDARRFRSCSTVISVTPLAATCLTDDILSSGHRFPRLFFCRIAKMINPKVNKRVQ